MRGAKGGRHLQYKNYSREHRAMYAYKLCFSSSNILRVLHTGSLGHNALSCVLIRQSLIRAWC